ncbi:hypothetical protein QFC19_008600 [Naganishia cerealis]|uniref:Uncharacterized protein n=1 Tax=Naganishia cerealis TaxID=610337 RepID=A0ACC2V0Z5_9TREE|nr:hypothetical protein QFC19_008600 [Naganishia cerealis]
MSDEVQRAQQKFELDAALTKNLQPLWEVLMTKKEKTGQPALPHPSFDGLLGLTPYEVLRDDQGIAEFLKDRAEIHLKIWQISVGKVGVQDLDNEKVSKVAEIESALGLGSHAAIDTNPSLQQTSGSGPSPPTSNDNTDDSKNTYDGTTSTNNTYNSKNSYDGSTAPPPSDVTGTDA